MALYKYFIDTDIDIDIDFLIGLDTEIVKVGHRLADADIDVKHRLIDTTQLTEVHISIIGNFHTSDVHLCTQVDRPPWVGGLH